MLDAVLGDDVTHAVAGAPGADSTETLLAGLARLRSLGTVALGAAFPVEGDPLGLGGPRAFNTEALEAGEAVVADGSGLGLVPYRTGAAIAWRVLPADRRQLPDVGDADRGLRSGLFETANELARLDVARWRPEVADRLMDLRHREPLAGAPGVPPRCISLAERALQATEIVALALEDDGGAVSASEIEQRRAALTPLDRAARRALTAACSPEAWPPG